MENEIEKNEKHVTKEDCDFPYKVQELFGLLRREKKKKENKEEK